MSARDTAVAHHESLGLYRALLIRAREYRRKRGLAAWERTLQNDPVLKEARNAMADMRRLRKPTKVKKDWLINRERISITSRINSMVRFEKYSADVTVGETVHARYKPKTKLSSAILIINVGWMWNRNVYNKLYLNDNRCLTDNDIIPLSADELAVNIRNIRLYEAKIFHKERKEAYTGYIGQSKIGKRKAGFARTKQAAIDLAIREVTKDLDAQLKGETE